MDLVILSQYVVYQFSDQSPDGITPMKLQKLLYYIKAWTLVAGQNFINADFEHWDYGPVNREIYDYYKKYGRQAISLTEFKALHHSDYPKDIVDFIIENYIRFDAFKLSAMTHAEEPWKETKPNEVISNDLIYSYYKEQPFAKNFQPFDLINNRFYPLESYPFIIDMTKQDAQEITQYANYKNYKNFVHKAEQEFDQQWGKFLLI